MTQLSINFDFETKAQQAIIGLLSALNLDRKKPFRLVREIELDDYLLACATDGETEAYNVVDNNGNIPDGFSVCWRNVSHIIHELKINELIALAV